MSLVFPYQFFLWKIYNLTSYTYWRMLEHWLNCAVIVTYYDINDKTKVVEYILYHIHNCISLYNFRVSPKTIWAIVLFWFFSPLIHSIKILSGILIEYHTNNTLISTWYFGINLWSGPLFEPALSKARENFGRGELFVRPTRGSQFSRYQVMVNSWGVSLLANASLVLVREAKKSSL